MEKEGNRITDRLTFSCTACQCDRLLSNGAIKTKLNRIYFSFVCMNCNEAVIFEVDSVIVQLYEKPLPPGSKMVN